jgi:hypothetical protein
MIENLRSLFLILALLSFPAFAEESFRIEIIETDPGAGGILHSSEALYVHLKYHSDEPLRFQAKGYLHGGEVEQSAAYNPAPAYSAASFADAIAWIAYRDAVEIDEVKIVVYNQEWDSLDQVSLPLQMQWNGAPTKMGRRPAEWVQTLNAQQQTMTVDSMQQPPEATGGIILGSLLMMLMALSVPGYLALQFYTLRKYEGHWRKLALLPLWGTVPLFIYTLFALIAGSNLWPLMLLFLTPVPCIYLLIIGWMKRKQNKE